MEEKPNEFIDNFVQLFQQSLSNDNSIRERAGREIEHFLEPSNRLILIDACLSIIMSDTVPLSSQSLSFVILCRIFRPTSEFPFSYIYNQYKNLTEQMKVNIRSAFLRGLGFPQPEIYNQAAFLVCLIVVIDDSYQTIIEILQLLRDLSINPAHPESAHYSSIIAFREIYCSGHIDDLQNKCQGEFENFMRQQKNDCIEFLKYAYNYPVTFIIEVVKTLQQIIINRPNIIEDTNIIYDVFELMLPQVCDEILFREIFVLLYRLVVHLYDKPELLNIERIIYITSNGLSCDNPIFVSISVDFWNTVAYKEKKIIENNFLINRYRDKVKEYKGIELPEKLNEIKNIKCHNYCIMFISKSISDVLNVLTKIDFNDFTVDDPSFKQPYMFAVQLLSKIFFIEPNELFNQISALFDVSVNSDNWIVQHAFLKALITLSSDQKYKNVEDLFMTSTNFILNCTQSDNDRLSEAAIYTLEMIAKNYAIYSSKEAILQMIGVIKTLIIRKSLVASRSLKLLQRIVSQTIAPVDLLFDNLIELTCSALGREDFKSKEIFSSVFDTFNSIILQCTEKSIEKIKSFLKNSIISYLYDVLNEVQSQEITFMMGQCIFRTIIIIFKKFKGYLNSEGIETMQLLVNLLQQIENGSFIEDILLAISYVIPSLDKDSLNQLIPKLMEYVIPSLTSNSPSIIKNSLMIIENFFDVEPNLMLDQLPFITELILNGLKNHDFTPDFYPVVTKNLSYIIKAISSEKVNFFNAEIRDKMFEIYKSMSSLPINFSDDDDDDDGNEFANQVLESTFLGFARLITFSIKEPDQPFLKSREVAGFVFQPAILFQSFKNLSEIRDETYLSFLELIYATSYNFPNRSNVFIRRQLHAKIILLAMVSKNDKLKEKANEVWKKFVTL